MKTSSTPLANEALNPCKLILQRYTNFVMSVQFDKKATSISKGINLFYAPLGKSTGNSTEASLEALLIIN